MITDLRKRPMAPALEAQASAFGHPVLALGFRPFFLLAGLFATLVMPVWLLVFTGHLTLPTQVWRNAWHAHEMLFGFAGAVLAGFLFTAARNWTSLPTPSGAPLAALAALWVAGRVAILFSGTIPAPVVALIDLAFVPATALAIAIPIVRAKSWRNLGFVPLLLLLFVANLLFHFGPPAWSSRALRVAVDVIVLVIVVMGGRVIPSFTASGLGIEVKRSRLLDWASLIVTAVATLLEVVPVAPSVGGAALVAAGVLNGLRMVGWRSLATWKSPILWVLHLGYAWVAVGLCLSGIAAFVPGWMPNAPTHALAVGAIGMLILGMTARVSLGHTGRMLVVARPVAVAFGLLLLAAVVRSLGPLVLPSAYVPELVVSGVLWTAAFGIFTLVYAPILTSRRADGKPG